MPTKHAQGKTIQWQFPASEKRRIESMTRETARMSYPSSMSRGRRPLVKGGTKNAAEQFFVDSSHVQKMLAGSIKPHQYGAWHRAVSEQLASSLGSKVHRKITRVGVANKLLDTFMHQAMKYEVVRSNWAMLYLPLDRVVFNCLRSVDSRALAIVHQELTKNSYELTYDEYLSVQKALTAWCKELNARSGMTFKITSRIELNWIWARE